MDDIDAGHFAAKLADAIIDDVFEDEHVDTSHVVEEGRFARFTVRLANGQEFAISLEEL
jgi:hypothetical protein